MPFEPLRFVHASGLLVDHALDDIPPCPEALQQNLEDATVTAWERVVAACIENKADFLLLAGDTFDATDGSLRAEVVLRRRFEQLAEHDVRVFIAPGLHDPAGAWRSVRRLPDNVTTLLESNDDPVAVLRDGKVIASVASLDADSLRQWSLRDANPHAPEAHRGPLKIGLLVLDGKKDSAAAHAEGFAKSLAECRLDYLALGGRGERQMVAMRSGVAHHPGATQDIRLAQNGSRGCTLVEVDQAGAIRSTYIPTAVARRERCEIRVDAAMNQHQLIDQFREALESRKPEPGEQVWFMEWTVRGGAPQFEAILDEPHCARLVETAELAASLSPGPTRLHSFRRIADEVAAASPVATDMLRADFLATLDGVDPAAPASLASCFADVAPTNPQWLRVLEPLVGELDGERIAALARRLGRDWFASASAERPAA